MKIENGGAKIKQKTLLGNDAENVMPTRQHIDDWSLLKKYCNISVVDAILFGTKLPGLFWSCIMPSVSKRKEINV